MKAKADPQVHVKLFKKYWQVMAGHYDEFANELNKLPSGQVAVDFRREIHSHGKFKTDLVVSNVQTAPNLMGGLHMTIMDNINNSQELPKFKFIQLSASEDIQGFKKYLNSTEKSFDEWKKQRDETAAAAFGLHSQRSVHSSLAQTPQASQAYPVPTQYQHFPIQISGMAGHQTHQPHAAAAHTNAAFPNVFMGAMNGAMNGEVAQPRAGPVQHHHHHQPMFPLSQHQNLHHVAPQLPLNHPTAHQNSQQVLHQPQYLQPLNTYFPHQQPPK